MFPPPPLKSILFLLSLLLLLLFIYLTYSSHIRDYNPTSWSRYFHILSISWLLLRTSFWLLTLTNNNTWNPAVFYLLYYLPNPLQFASFVLLPLFYAQVLHRRKWRVAWGWIRGIYLIWFGGTVSFMIVFSVLAALQSSSPSDGDGEDPYGSRYIDSGFVDVLDRGGDKKSDDEMDENPTYLFRIIISFSFFVLSVTIAYYALKTRGKRRWQRQNSIGVSPRALFYINGVLFLIFGSRAVYQLGQVLRLWSLPALNLLPSKDVKPVIFLVFVLWDYLPTILVLGTVMSGKGEEFEGIKSLLYRGMKGGETRQHRGKSLGSQGGKRNIPTYGVFALIEDDGKYSTTPPLHNSTRTLNLDTAGTGTGTGTGAFLGSQSGSSVESSYSELNFSHVRGLPWVGSLGSVASSVGSHTVNSIVSPSTSFGRGGVGGAEKGNSTSWGRGGLVRGAVFNDERRYWRDEVDTPPKCVQNSYTANYNYYQSPSNFAASPAATVNHSNNNNNNNNNNIVGNINNNNNLAHNQNQNKNSNPPQRGSGRQLKNDETRALLS